jgi:hypothetical protein
MGISGETKGTTVAAAPIKVERVIKGFFCKRTAGMMKGGLDLDFKVLRFPGVVSNLGIGG